MKVVPYLVGLAMFVNCVTEGLGVLVSDPEGNAVMDLNSCVVYEGPEAHGVRGPVRPAPAHIFRQLVSACKPSRRGATLLFPGTKWCGPGNSAQNFYDLGSRAAEDACCRDHDHCPQVLEPGQCRQDVCNDHGVVLSHCRCDARFRRCLHAVRTDVADFIGWIYFDLVNQKCFKARIPCDDFREQCPIALHSVVPYNEGRSSSLASSLFGSRVF